MKDVDITDQGWDSSNNDIIGRRGREGDGAGGGRAGGVPVGERAYQLPAQQWGFALFHVCIEFSPLLISSFGDKSILLHSEGHTRYTHMDMHT